MGPDDIKLLFLCTYLPNIERKGWSWSESKGTVRSFFLYITRGSLQEDSFWDREREREREKERKR